MNGMQQFDIRGGETLLSAAGNFIRFDSASGKPIRIRGDGQDLGQLMPDESLTLPDAVQQWAIVADDSEAGVVRIGYGRIAGHVTVSRPPVLVMETGVGQVAAGAGPGWVSGTPSGLAAGATDVVIFDLGRDWAQYPVIAVVVNPIGPSSGLTASFLTFSDAANVQNNARRGFSASQTGFGAPTASFTTAGGAVGLNYRVQGRYVRFQITNADASNALGAGSKIALAAYPT